MFREAGADKSLASRISSGSVAAFGTEFEGTCRSNGDGTWKTWVRYVGAAHIDSTDEKAGTEEA